MLGKNITPEQIQQMLNLKNQELNSIQVAKILNISQSSVIKHIKKQGLSFKNPKTPQFYKEQILNLLKQEKTPIFISEELNLNYVSTQQMCSKLGYKFALNQGNVRYFQFINTVQKAYFAGFIAADGALVKVSKSYPSIALTITIHNNDRQILEKLREEIGCEHKLKQINHFNSFDKTKMTDHVRFSICNKELAQDLLNLGIGHNKSMTIGNVIENIPYELRNAFIIGYLDGDGSVSLRKGAKNKSNPLIRYNNYGISIQFRGTKEFLQGISNHLDLSCKTISFSKTYKLYIHNKKDILKFFNCYDNLNFYLKRKYDKFLERINHPSYKKFIQD